MQVSNNISVIATVYNEASSMTDFIESLTGQSMPPDEIIIVDGLSTDGTNKILKNFEKAGNLKLISQKCNIAEGRNIAIRNASTKYIAATDAGCKVDKHWLEEIMACFHSEEKPDVVAGNFTFECHSLFEEAVVLATFNPDRENTDVARYYPSSRSIAFRKEAWEAVKGYPEWLYAAEDTLFNIQLHQKGFEFMFAKKAIVKWRPRETYKALSKQRFNFSRGNGRVGIGTSGYLINIYYHGLILFPLLLTPISIYFIFISLYASIQHVKKNIWPQAKKSQEKSDVKSMKYRVALLMEHSRLVGIFGFLAGRWDRLVDPKYISSLQEWMGVASLDELKK